MAIEPTQFSPAKTAWDDLSKFAEDAAKTFGELTGGGQSIKDANGNMLPYFSTGARTFIKAGGKPIGICTDFRWNISYNGQPVQTIDAAHPWDIDVGQVEISAVLNNIFDPLVGPEATGMFHIMQSAIHQPFIEIQALDKQTGSSLFFARGMFLGVSGNVSKGQLSGFSASFKGVAYQHYVQQLFQPYGIMSDLSGFVSGLQGLASDVTGGIP